MVLSVELRVDRVGEHLPEVLTQHRLGVFPEHFFGAAVEERQLPAVVDREEGVPDPAEDLFGPLAGQFEFVLAFFPVADVTDDAGGPDELLAVPQQRHVVFGGETVPVGPLEREVERRLVVERPEQHLPDDRLGTFDDLVGLDDARMRAQQCLLGVAGQIEHRLVDELEVPFVVERVDAVVDGFDDVLVPFEFVLTLTALDLAAHPLEQYLDERLFRVRKGLRARLVVGETQRPVELAVDVDRSAHVAGDPAGLVRDGVSPSLLGGVPNPEGFAVLDDPPTVRVIEVDSDAFLDDVVVPDEGLDLVVGPVDPAQIPQRQAEPIGAQFEDPLDRLPLAEAVVCRQPCELLERLVVGSQCRLPLALLRDVGRDGHQPGRLCVPVLDDPVGVEPPGFTVESDTELRLEL